MPVARYLVVFTHVDRSRMTLASKTASLAAAA